MRIFAQILGLAVALVALIGFGALATNSMRGLELKQQRALDADINWILAQRRGDAAKDAGKAQTQASAPTHSPARPAEATTNGAASRDDTPARRGEARDGETRGAETRDDAKEEARQAMAQARKIGKRARNSRRNALLPRDFGRLPLFTVETLLGFR